MRGEKIISNFFYFFLSFATVSLFNYLFWIVLGKMMSPEDYGILFTVMSMFYILSPIVTLGFIESLPKFISDYKAKKSAISSLIKLSANLIFYNSLAISSLIFIFSDSISTIFYGSLQMSFPIKLLSVIILSGSMQMLFRSILRGAQSFRDIFITDFAGNIVKVVSAFILIYIGFGLIGGAAGIVLWFSTSLIMFYYFSKRYIDTKSIIRIKESIEYLKYSLTSIVSLVSLWFIHTGTVFLISVISTLENAAFFAAASVIGQIVLFVPNVLYGPLLPMLSKIWSSDRKLFSYIFSRSVKIITMVGVPLVLVLSLIPETIVKAFYSTKYMATAEILPLFLFATLIYGLNMILLITLYSAKRPKRRMISVILGSLSLLLLSVLLIPGYGLMGAAYAFLISQVIIAAVSAYYLRDVADIRMTSTAPKLLIVFIIFGFILYTGNITGNLMMSVLVATTAYILLIFRINVINKKDMIILKYFNFKKIKNKLRLR